MGVSFQMTLSLATNPFIKNHVRWMACHVHFLCIPLHLLSSMKVEREGVREECANWLWMYGEANAKLILHLQS